MLNYFSLHFVLSFFCFCISNCRLNSFFCVYIPSKTKSWCNVRGSLWGKKEQESLFFIRVQQFFWIILFFLSLPFFEYATSNPTLFHGENVYISAYTHEAETDVDTKALAHKFPFSYLCTRKRNPHFSRNKIFFFCSIREASAMMIFIHFFLCCFAAVSAFRYQYVCIAFNVANIEERGGKKNVKNHLPSCVLFNKQKRENEKKSVKELTFLLKIYRNNSPLNSLWGFFFIVLLFYLRHGRMNNSAR